MKKPKIFLIFMLCVCALLLFQLISLKESNHLNRSSFRYNQRQLLEPASSAGEWMKRLKLDIPNQQGTSDFLVNLYAELPPVEQWDEVSKQMESLAGDHKQLEKLLGDHHYYGDGIQRISQKLMFFSGLLKESDVEPMLRQYMLSGRNQYYEKEEVLNSLLSLSNDRDATLSWIKINRADLLQHEVSSGRSSSDPKSDWEQALADNRIDEAIRLIKESIPKEVHRHEISNKLQKLIRIGILTDRLPVAQEATREMLERTIRNFKNNEYHSSYYMVSLFHLPAKTENWQEIIDMTQTIRKAYEASDRDFHGDFWSFDEGRAVYLTALYKLGKTAEFEKEIEQAKKNAAESPENFYSLLRAEAYGQKPLGIHYLEHLKSKGQADQAVAHAMHFLARYPGEDAFYEALMDLDKAKARKFMDQMRIYDPYEERPLIWIAESQRREGELELAQKSIEQAIALDPSDGDHGKDSRMFCYEILARIHQDAGRQDKAKFFRDVVESIRQGEAADDFLYAGLIAEATKRYQAALGKFEDAYCLQSRLALTLARNGQFEESVKHFKKAFELMPVSFGPRESHCFGCEGLFSDPRVLEIARPILDAFQKENPTNPRAPYLLGLVLDEANEHEQAAVAYRRAFEIDPQYYNAATRLLGLLKKNPEHFEEAQVLRGKIFEIAPYAFKVKYIPNQAKLRQYWESTQNFPPSPLELPELSFGKETKATGKTEQYVQSDSHSYRYYGESEQAIDGWTPAEIRRQNTFLKWLDQN